MINTLLLIAAVVLLLAIVRIRAFDAGRKLGQGEGFLYAMQVASGGVQAQADPESRKQREWEQFAAGVAPWN